MHQPTNTEIADHLALIAEYYKYNRDKPRQTVFERAEANIRSYPVQIVSGNQAETIFKGIAEGIRTTIDDFIRSNLTPPYVGTSTRLQELIAQDGGGFFTIRAFNKVYGIGIATAPLLYQQGFRSIDQLVYANLNDSQRWGVHYYHHFLQKIPRSEMDEIINVVKRCWENKGISDATWVVGGSYRRGATSSGDIDIIVQASYIPSLNRVVHPRDLAQWLIDCGLVKVVLAAGDVTFMGVAQLGPDRVARRIDIKVYVPGKWAYGIFHSTGSAGFNAKLRSYANSLGLTMNEYEMKQTNGSQSFPANSEEDIFRILGLEYIKPEHRSPDAPLIPLRRY